MGTRLGEVQNVGEESLKIRGSYKIFGEERQSIRGRRDRRCGYERYKVREDETQGEGRRDSG